VSIACSVYLIIPRLAAFGGRSFKQVFFWVVLVMLLLTLATHFGIQPIMESLKERSMPQAVMESIFRDRFARWHGVSSIVYLVQSLLGLVLIFKQNTR